MQWFTGDGMNGRSQSGVVVQFVAKPREGGVAAPEDADPRDTGAEDDAPSPDTGENRFVGRSEELQTLRSALESALAIRGRLVLLGGDPGIGKSRLTQEFIGIARGRRIPVRVGRCHEGAGAPIYWPWLQVIRAQAQSSSAQRLRNDLGVGAEDIAQWVPEVRQLLGLQELAAPAAESEHARFRLFDSIGGFLRRAAQPAGLVIVLEDLHWADPASLLLLNFLAADLQDCPLLIVGTHRENDIAEDVRASLRRVPHAQRLRLGGLQPAEVQRLLGVFAGAELPQAVARAIGEETEGNPFFIGEILRHLIEQKALVKHEGQWLVQGSLRSMPLPESVREVIGRRLARLSPACASVLEVAAVIGREFSLPRLQAVTLLYTSKLNEVMDEAVAAQVLNPLALGAAGGTYGFVHALIRETLYHRLTQVERLQLHLRVGLAIEQAEGETDASRQAELAHHFYEAYDGYPESAARALDACRRAGEHALAHFGFEEAARQFKRALRVLGHGAAPETRNRLLLQLAESLRRAGDSREARTRYLEAADMAVSQGFPELLARSVLGLGMVNFGASWWAGLEVDHVLVGLLKRARRAVGDAFPALRAALAARLTLELYWSPAFEFCGPLAEEAKRYATGQEGTPEAALAAAAQSYSRLGPDGTGEDYNELVGVAVRLAEASGKADLTLNNHVLHFLGVSNWCPDRDWFDEQVNTYWRIAAELREPQHKWFGEVLRFAQVLCDGDLELAETVAAGARDLAEAADDRVGAMVWGAQIGISRYFQNRMAEMEAGFRGFAARYPALPSWNAVVALTLAESGREAEARALLDQAGVNDFTDLRRDTLWFNGMTMFSLAAFGCGHGNACARLYELLQPYAERYVMVPPSIGSRGPVTFALAALALGLGRVAEATRHAEAAIEAARRMRDIPYELYAQALHAVCLALDRNQLSRARELLEISDAACRQRGIAPLSERVWWQPRLRELAAGRGAVGSMEAFLGQGAEGGALRGRRRALRIPLLPALRRLWERMETAVRVAGIRVLGRWVGGMDDATVERRFGGRWMQWLIYQSMVMSFQPRQAFGFSGDIAYELSYEHSGARPPALWTVRVRGRRASAVRGAASQAAVRIRMSVNSLMRILVGQLDSVAAMVEGRTEVNGDLAVASRLVDMFGGISPVGHLSPGELQRGELARSRQVRELLSDLDIAPADLQLSLQARREAALARRQNLSAPSSSMMGAVTIIISDMEGFTQMTEALGDSGAHRVMQEHNRIVRRQVLAHRGHEMELQGDSFLLAFIDRHAALHCAAAIQRDFDEHNRRHGQRPIRVRMGIHTGEAIKDTGKFFGKTVIVASRVSAKALGGEILVTDTTSAGLEAERSMSFGEARSYELKGLSGEYRVRPMHWQQSRSA